MPIAQIEDLKARVVAYARLVEDMIEQCRSSLVKRTPEVLSALVNNEEPRANELEVELEEECTSLIAQHQPMARELRTLLMVLRMTNDLERMADHAVNIAEAALESIGLSTIRPDADLMTLFDETIRMVDSAVRSFISDDAELGQQVCESDASVDQRATDILERMSSSMTNDPFTIENSLCVLKIAANLERIADLSTNIGEDVIYMTEGRVIKHHRLEER
ncbi:MAG TPA: phosphate signaling complex protein PhoU [Spirochaetia bacterium]|nr:phosphate signaling complex protein PhoU [Spirochaetia bacterium]